MLLAHSLTSLLSLTARTLISPDYSLPHLVSSVTHCSPHSVTRCSLLLPHSHGAWRAVKLVAHLILAHLKMGFGGDVNCYVSIHVNS
jgi:hypothetical protein